VSIKWWVGRWSKFQ